MSICPARPVSVFFAALALSASALAADCLFVKIKADYSAFVYKASFVLLHGDPAYSGLAEADLKSAARRFASEYSECLIDAAIELAASDKDGLGRLLAHLESKLGNPKSIRNNTTLDIPNISFTARECQYAAEQESGVQLR